jgi:hypothetical protein
MKVPCSELSSLKRSNLVRKIPFQWASLHHQFLFKSNYWNRIGDPCFFCSPHNVWATEETWISNTISNIFPIEVYKIRLINSVALSESSKLNTLENPLRESMSDFLSNAISSYYTDHLLYTYWTDQSLKVQQEEFCWVLLWQRRPKLSRHFLLEQVQFL